MLLKAISAAGYWWDTDAFWKITRFDEDGGDGAPKKDYQAKDSFLSFCLLSCHSDSWKFAKRHSLLWQPYLWVQVFFHGLDAQMLLEEIWWVCQFLSHISQVRPHARIREINNQPRVVGCCYKDRNFSQTTVVGINEQIQSNEAER